MPPTFDLLLLAAFLAAGGEWLRRRFRHHTRSDRHLVCTACGHDLFGKLWDRQHCPECGAWLGDPAGLRIGNRRPHPWGHGTGLALLGLAGLIAGAVAVRAYREFDLQQAKPLALLKYEAVSGGERSRRAALEELLRRAETHRLAPFELDPVVADVVARAGDSSRPWEPATGDMIARLHRDARVDFAGWRRYADASASVSARVGPWARPGEPLVVEVTVSRREGTVPAFARELELRLYDETAGTLLGEADVTPDVFSPPDGFTPVARDTFCVPVTPRRAFAGGLVRAELELRTRDAVRDVRRDLLRLVTVSRFSAWEVVQMLPGPVESAQARLVLASAPRQAVNPDGSIASVAPRAAVSYPAPERLLLELPPLGHLPPGVVVHAALDRGKGARLPLGEVPGAASATAATVHLLELHTAEPTAFAVVLTPLFRGPLERLASERWPLGELILPATPPATAVLESPQMPPGLLPLPTRTNPPPPAPVPLQDLTRPTP